MLICNSHERGLKEKLTPTLLPPYTESDLESPILILESSCFWNESTDILDSPASVIELHPPQSKDKYNTYYNLYNIMFITMT